MELQVRSITKSAKRKVNLRAISSEYDNIEWGTFVTADISYSTQEEFDEANDRLATMARKAVERDIRNYFIVLQHMAKDKHNESLVGTGESLYVEDGEIDALLDNTILPLPEDPTKEIEEPKNKTKVKESKTKEIERPKKQTKESKKEEKKDDFNDIDDLLDDSPNEGSITLEELATEASGEIKEEPKGKPTSKSNSKKEDNNDELDDLDFLDDLGVEDSEDSEDNKPASKTKPKKTEELEISNEESETDNEETDLDDKEKPKEYDEVDLDDFDFNDAAGDLFND